MSMRWLPVIGLYLAMLGTPLHAGPQVGGPFELTDQNGARVTDATFRGKPVLLYFGFTTCPDVCPVDLAKIVKIAAGIRKGSGVSVTPIFVTIDPERDTPSRMKTYVSAFSPDVVGLTGTASQIASITDAYHVYYKKVPLGNGADYTMEHSTFLFLLGPDGRYLDHYGRTLTDKDIVPRAIAALRGP